MILRRKEKSRSVIQPQRSTIEAYVRKSEPVPILFGLIVAERGFAGNGLSWEGGELVNVEEPCSRRGFE